MEERRKDARREPVIAELEALAPEDHLPRRLERVREQVRKAAKGQ